MNWQTGSVTFAIALAAAMPAFASPRDDVLQAVSRCAAIADSTARLACYDALAPRVRDALATPPETLAHNPTTEEQKSWFGFDIDKLFAGNATEEKQTTPQQFGQESTPAAQQQHEQVTAEEIDSISATVTDYSFTPFGKFIVFLDNGQVWRQQEGDSDRAHFERNPKDNKVTISRGAFGSYNMEINGGNHRYKVKRVK